MELAHRSTFMLCVGFVGAAQADSNTVTDKLTPVISSPLNASFSLSRSAFVSTGAHEGLQSVVGNRVVAAILTDVDSNPLSSLLSAGQSSDMSGLDEGCARLLMSVSVGRQHLRVSAARDSGGPYSLKATSVILCR